jgi:hypothetical protein
MINPLEESNIPRPALNFFAYLKKFAGASDPPKFLFFCLKQMYTLSRTMHRLQKIELSFNERRDYLVLEFHVVRDPRSGAVERVVLSNWESEGVLYWPYIKGTRCRYITYAKGLTDFLNPKSQVNDEDLETYSGMGDEYGYEDDEEVYESSDSDG